MFKKVLIVLSVFALIFTTTPAQASSHAKSLANLGEMDIMFAQKMIPHHQQAIDMSKLALKNGVGADVKSLAKGIIVAQKREISQMKYWLTSTKSPLMSDHDMGMSGMSGMSGMGGMLTVRQMKTLKSLKGSKFSKAYLEAMIVHHVGALEMLSDIDGTKNIEVKKLAKDIRSGQSVEISSMKKMLAKLA